jgi:hypothetical protein
MIEGRFQSIEPQEVKSFRESQINKEKERRPLYGFGSHVPGNKHPGKYCGGHKYKNAKAEES